ncbi:MAG: chemotaxis protein CheW [Planctomycetota bacterium]
MIGSTTFSQSDERFRIVPIDVGQHRLALPAETLLGVRDDWKILEESTPQAGYVVQCSSGPIAAIHLAQWLGGPPDVQNSQLVAVRSIHSHETLGLFVDDVGRPRTVRHHELHRIPSWVASAAPIPMNYWAIQTNQDTKVRHVIDVDRFRDRDGSESNGPATQEAQEAMIDQDFGASPVQGRGVLVFAPAELLQSKMRCAIAVPMSLVLAVLADFTVLEVPTRIPHLAGVVLWNGFPVPVIRLGQALSLHDHERSLTNGTSDPSVRMLLVRTPNDQVIACLTHSQMRTQRTPQTTGAYFDHDLNADLLLGSFLTADGPVAVPDFDQLLRVTPETAQMMLQENL